MAFAAPLALIATAVGGGISAYGAYASGQAKSAMARYQQGSDLAMAKVAADNAQYDIASGGIKALQAGLVGRAAMGRLGARAGAGNVAGKSVADLQRSQSAITMEKERIQIADAAHADYGEQVQAARFTAEAGAKGVEAQTDIAAGELGALGSIASTAGSVAGKWYDLSAIGKGGSGGIDTGMGLAPFGGSSMFT